MDLKAQLRAKIAANQGRHARARDVNTLSAESRELPSARLIAIDQISANPFQPRLSFDPEALDSLAASIKAEGLLQPLVLRPNGTRGYQLVAGERRLRACRKLGMSEVLAIVSGRSDLESAQSALSENLQRDSLSDFEVSRSIDQIERLASESSGELSRSRLAKLAGVSRPALYRYLAFRQLPTGVIERLERSPDQLSAVSAEQIVKRLQGEEERGVERAQLEALLSEVFDDFLSQEGAPQRALLRALEDALAALRRDPEGEAGRERTAPRVLLRAGQRVGHFSRSGDQLELKLKLKSGQLKGRELDQLERLIQRLFEEGE